MNKKLNLITRTFLLCLLVSYSAMAVFTQENGHSCKVIVFEENIKTGKHTSKVLGEFAISFASKKKNLKALTKTFQIPDTKLFVSASIVYPDLPDEILATLILGKRRFKNGWKDFSDNNKLARLAREDVLSIAGANFPLESFEKGKTSSVMVILIGKRKARNITLECRE